MGAWLCPVKGRSWHIIRKEGIFGAPRHAYKTMKQVKIGDRLVFCLLGSIKGIVAIYKVTSQVYENNSDIWGRDRYPIRVKIKLVHNFENSKSLIPLGHVYGGNSRSGVVIEPFLKNVWIVRMEEDQYSKLAKLFKTTNEEITENQKNKSCYKD